MVKISGWESKTLGTLINEGKIVIQTGPFGSVLSAKEFVKYGIPVVAVREIREGYIQIFDETPCVSMETYNRLSKYNLATNDLVFARKGNVERSALIPLTKTKYFLGSDGICLRVITKNLLPQYLFYAIQSNTVRSFLIQNAYGTTMAGLNEKILSSIPLFLPVDIDEQSAIAETFSDIDRLISSLQKLIEKKKAIKQGAMQELLTGKKRLPGFSGEWNEGCIGDYCRCIRGVSYNGGTDLFPDENSYSFRLLRANNIQNGNFVPNDVQFVKKSCVSEEQVLHSNDILVCMANGSKPLVGKNCFLNVRNGVYTFGAFMGCIRARTPSTCMKYIFQIMNSTTYWENISLLLSGSSINNLRPNDILNMTYKFPTAIEQQAIAQVLSDMDFEIEQLEKKLAKYQQIKQGMMQELLTGQIRLVDADRKEQPKTQILQERQPAHNQYFDDAVMIAGIVNAFYSEKYPLGRKKVQKLLYLVRRKEQADISAFHKKAAGPYADEVRYKGGEPIAQKNKYIQVKRNEKGSRFEKGMQMQQALTYLQDWGKQGDVDWLVSQFQYTSVNELELLATVDMAICDLRREGKGISVASIKDLIRSNKEWRDKLKKTYFRDSDIQRAIKKCQDLFES
ncbi:restriction endonuclease subunit S [Acutalibacter sp. LFL-21]|uniref:restriction endonuclease subunit S n=1 Tax=Acutalibacter sp. LFL-21 TaxID=2983399 RepID=UPI0021D68D92|nr:restriction endonuclease subunit S [Acutalibacter sp. LFL-21]MCU7652102.1 restriction endonuclease subunit S [Acutalibacter sp. LFL-21]